MTLSAYGLRCEYRVTPLGIDEPQDAGQAQSAAPAQIADFGQNIAGRVRLTIRDAPPGRRIQIRHGEVLDGPRLYTENLRSAEATDVYVTRGRPVEAFEPQFTVHGFRYAEITGHPFADGDVVARVLHSDTPWTGEFSCSDPLINQIAANIGWSQRGNFVAVPTDCPQRDERQGWLADAQVFLPTACRNADVAAFFARWLRDVRDGQRPSGAFGDIAPMIGDRPESAPGWGDAGVLIPWQLWREYGDRRTLELSYPSMVAWIDHVARHNPSLLWRNRTGNNYGDWLHVGQDTPRDLVATAYFARSARVVADASRVLGADGSRFEDLADRIADAFAAQFVAADGTVGSGTQTGYLLALGFGLVPTVLVGAAAARLAAQVTEHGPQAGFLGLPLLAPVLTAHGRADLGARILFGQLIVVALITWWLRHGVGESQRWLEARQRRAAGHAAGLPGGQSWSQGLRTLLRGPLLKPLFFLIGMYGIYNLAAGTSGFYMPYLYNQFGLHSQAADVGLECFKGALSIGAAALIFMPFVDKVNRRGMLAISIIGQAVAIGLFVVFKVSYPVAISYVLLGGICSGFGVQSFYQIWSAELFPTSVRATAQGLTFAVVRIGLGIFSFYVPDITKAGFKPLAVIMFCMYAAAGLIGVVFAPRNTQGRSLEEIHGSDTSRPAAARV